MSFHAFLKNLVLPVAAVFAVLAAVLYVMDANEAGATDRKRAADGCHNQKGTEFAHCHGHVDKATGVHEVRVFRINSKYDSSGRNVYEAHLDDGRIYRFGQAMSGDDTSGVEAIPPQDDALQADVPGVSLGTDAELDAAAFTGDACDVEVPEPVPSPVCEPEVIEKTVEVVRDVVRTVPADPVTAVTCSELRTSLRSEIENDWFGASDDTAAALLDCLDRNLGVPPA